MRYINPLALILAFIFCKPSFAGETQELRGYDLKGFKLEEFCVKRYEQVVSSQDLILVKACKAAVDKRPEPSSPERNNQNLPSLGVMPGWPAPPAYPITNTNLGVKYDVYFGLRTGFYKKAQLEVTSKYVTTSYTPTVDIGGALFLRLQNLTLIDETLIGASILNSGSFYLDFSFRLFGNSRGGK